MKSSKWLNSAKRRRLHLKQRARLAGILGWPVDCVATTGEMLQTLRASRSAPATI